MPEVAHATQPPGFTDRLEWVDRQGLSGIESAILVRMALQANSGSYWQSQAKLAELTRFSRRTVIRALKSLVDRGLLAMRTRFAAPNVYTPRWGNLEHPTQLRQRVTIGVGQSDAGVRQRVTIECDSLSQTSLFKNSEEREEKSKTAAASPPPREPARRTAAAGPIIEKLGEDADFEVIEAIAEVSPASWDPSWAPVVTDVWEKIRDSQNVESPVGLMVHRLRKLAERHDVTARAPELRERPSAKKLSYAEYFRR